MTGCAGDSLVLIMTGMDNLTDEQIWHEFVRKTDELATEHGVPTEANESFHLKVRSVVFQHVRDHQG